MPPNATNVPPMYLQPLPGRHKPGPAHRAKSFPVVDRTFHQQKMVDSAAAHHPVNWEGGYTHKQGGEGTNHTEGSTYSIGIVPNASPSGRSKQSWSNTPHHRSGTADAARRKSLLYMFASLVENVKTIKKSFSFIFTIIRWNSIER